MNARWRSPLPVVAAPLIAVALACAQPQANEQSLRDSFVERIAGTAAVTDFSRDGSELEFSGPAPSGEGQGGTAAWRVVIDSALVEPNELDDAMPYVGRISADWYANGQVVEFLGNMSALPPDFLDRGLGQECWAFWMQAEDRWDW